MMQPDYQEASKFLIHKIRTEYHHHMHNGLSVVTLLIHGIIWIVMQRSFLV